MHKPLLCNHNLTRRSRAFTLIEMLVVIAVIGILASMLMPSLMRSLEAARTIVCSNNLKQQSMAVNSYTNDYRYYAKFQYWRAYYAPYLGEGKEWWCWWGFSSMPKEYICPAGKPELENGKSILYRQGLTNKLDPNRFFKYLPRRAIYKPSKSLTHMCYWSNAWNETSAGSPSIDPNTHASGRPCLYADSHVKVEVDYLWKVPDNAITDGWDWNKASMP